MNNLRRLLVILILFTSVAASAGEESPFQPAKNRHLVAVINLEGLVEGVMERTVRRRISEALRDGADVLLFEITTDGGFLDSGMEIAKLIDEQKVHTAIFVKDKAFSAGTLISLAADEIYIQEKAWIGSAAMIDITETVVPKDPKEQEVSTADMKALAIYYRLLKDLSNRNGYNHYIVQGMVQPFSEFFIYEYRGPGAKRIKTILAQEQIAEFAEENSLYIHSEADLVPLESYSKAGLLALMGKDALEFNFGSKVAESREEIVDDMKALFSKDGTASAEPIMEVRQYGENWWELFVWFMAQPVVRGIILMLGLLGIFIEFKTPGFGFPGAIGAACIFLFFFVAYLADLADWIEPIIFAIGVILLALEMFVIPGFGIAGISGMLLMAIAFILAMQNFTIPRTSGQWGITLENIGSVVLAAIGFLLGAWLIAKYFPKARRVAGHIIAFGPDAAAVHGGAAKDDIHAELIGQSGKAETALRPAGRAVIDGKRYDVVTRGGFIDVGTEVEVSEVSGNRIVVKPADSKPLTGDI